MGEAKRKREQLRQLMLRETDQWSFPPSPEEAALVAKLDVLPSVTARRVPEDQIAYMRMPGKECHANCAWYASNDPEGKARHVLGWWRQPEAYVLHSVIERDGQHVCITPQLQGTPATFEFVPDAEIEVRDEGDVRVFYRDGRRWHPGVRARPQEMIEHMEKVRRRLRAGGNPYKAWEP